MNFKVIECKGYPGDEEFNGNVDVSFEAIPGKSSADFIKDLWIETPDGLENCLGSGNNPEILEFSFFSDKWCDHYPLSVDFFYGPKITARKVATAKVTTHAQ